MLKNGLPARLGPPLRFLFTGRLSVEAQDVADRIERVRSQIAARTDFYTFAQSHSPLGMVRWPESAGQPASPDTLLSSTWLAHSVSVPRRWGLFLHLCAEALGAGAILEMGACVGISGAYLASARSNPRFVTLEGSLPLARIAETTLATVSGRAVVMRGTFESGLDGALALFASEHLPLDIAYLDGHHTEAATLHYVRTLVPHLRKGALIVLDDIYLYAEMWRAWQTLAFTPGVAAAVNAGRFGLLVWDGGGTGIGRQFDLAPYTGWWRVGQARDSGVQRPRSS